MSNPAEVVIPTDVETATGDPDQRWRRSHEGSARPQRFDPEEDPLPQPQAEVERILREYACECYAVGRGESMYYLVEDLPRLARAATQEILAIKPGDPEQNGALPRSEALRRNGKGRKGHGSGRMTGLSRVAKSAVAVLPLVAILAALVIAIGFTFSESIGALVGTG